MASMTGLSAAQLAQLLDGEEPMAMPTYNLPSIYNGVLPSLPAISNYGPPQGTKGNRAALPDAFNSLSEPWGGAYDQTSYRNGQTRRDIIQNIPAPPIQTASNYSTLDTVTPLDINRLGLSSSPFRQTPAERAIAEITVNGGGRSPTGGLNRGRPTPPRLPTFQNDDPLLAEALAIGRAYKPSASVQAALAAPPPPGSPGAPQAQRSGSLLSMLLGGFGGGQAQGQDAGLAALLSGMGGHDTSSPEAFAASVTRPSNMPGVPQFTGTVQQGQAGQNRFGSTARNELLALYT